MHKIVTKIEIKVEMCPTLAQFCDSQPMIMLPPKKIG